jgi:hypothetical protein
MPVSGIANLGARPSAASARDDSTAPVAPLGRRHATPHADTVAVNAMTVAIAVK